MRGEKEKMDEEKIYDFVKNKMLELEEVKKILSVVPRKEQEKVIENLISLYLKAYKNGWYNHEALEKNKLFVA